MAEALKRKLGSYTRLLASECEAMEKALKGRIRKFGPQHDIVVEGANPDHVYFLISGWACRYKVLQDGRRQTMALLLDGDVCDLAFQRRSDHSIQTVTAARVAEVPVEIMAKLRSHHQGVANALRLSALIDEAISREWIVSLGQRTALERLAHLFCEIFTRCRFVGLDVGESCPMPLTQTDLAAATGLSIVHVNRTLKQLRSSELIMLHGKRLTMLDFERLQDLALFNPAYLRIEREGRHSEADGRAASQHAI